jgi:phosphatidylserine/phosphatidylglycerophosphate/cardiolipin synthase-like enzyme
VTTGVVPADRVVATPAECRAAILEVIRSAKREIRISLFRCNDDEIFTELASACRRGVSVNAIVTTRAAGGGAKLEKLRRRLLDAGATVIPYADPVVKYHAKYLVADAGPAVVASLNLTKKCFSRTLDALVVTYDPEVVSGLCDVMSADRETREAGGSLSRRLIVGPERARAQLAELVRGATSSIRIIDAKLSDPAFAALLAGRRAAGVRVDIFTDKRYGDLKSHGKIWLIDDRTAVVGGLALAAVSLDFRREVAIVVDDAEAIAVVRQLFDRLENAASPRPVDAARA